jgi:uncharacterized membrane protein
LKNRNIALRKEMKEIKTNNLFLTVKLLAAFGILLSTYLLWQQNFRSDFQPCSINSFINCDAIISGDVAKTFGVPTPLFGLVGYIVILIAAFLKKTELMLGMAAFGLLFCLWIAYKELFELRVICPICIACQLTMIGIFGTTLYLLKKKDLK